MLTEFLNFIFSSFWRFTGILILLFPVSIIISSLLNAIVTIITRPWSRFMRMLMVRKHGWPTNPNLDADGDFKPVEEKQETTK